jgi:hypothetical protein
MTPEQTEAYAALRTLRDAGLVTDRHQLNAAWSDLTRQFARNPQGNPWPNHTKRTTRRATRPRKGTRR